MNTLPAQLRENVRLLGDLLGESILTHNGRALFDKIEEIRGLSKALHETDRQGSDYPALMAALASLDDREILAVARAFAQFLNLVNIADQEFFYGPLADQEDALATYLESLSTRADPQSVFRQLTELRIELVLTAHPTEALRRTLIHKYDRVASALSERRRGDLLPYEADQVRSRLPRLIEEIWHTDEIRATKPSAVDEAKWGFTVVENSLWGSVADVLRHVDRLCQRHWGKGLPLEAAPLRFFSWMGGDRDGNPNVTSEISRQVLLLGRWKAADLCLRDVQGLMEDLSMHAAEAELASELSATSEMPYRDILRQLRDRLRATLAWAESSLQTEQRPAPAAVIHCKEDLLAPLLLCHRSLEARGLHHVSKGPLTDLIRRIHAFGINLLPLDIRQGSERHEALFGELTRYLELGDYQA